MIKFLKKQFTRSSIISLLKEQKIKFTVGSCPEIYKEKLFKKVKLYKELPNANFVGKISIAFSRKSISRTELHNKSV